LVVATSRDACARAGDFTAALRRGYAALGEDPQKALDDLLGEVSDLDKNSEEAQLQALVGAHAFTGPSGDTPGLNPVTERGWVRWASRHGVISPSAVEKVSGGFAGCG
jgi:hypothetical protein